MLDAPFSGTLTGNGYMTMEQNTSAPQASTRRRYDSSGRRERARRVRDEITDTARDLFLSRGYTATTVAAIAAAAHVSVETIYKGFGGKPGLVRAIIEKGLAGEGPVPAERRSDVIRDTEPDPRKIVAAWGAFTAELAPSVGPIYQLARDAAGDPEVAAVLDQLAAERHKRMRLNAAGLAAAGHLRPGVTVDQAADIMWACSSPELYELLVTRRGWPPARFGEFIAQALTGALLPADGNGR
jgi:AcrR family transcriptional regulator